MAKKKQHIDDLFKDAFKGSEKPLDGSEWDKLFNELHPEKKRRFAWWWFGAPLALLAIGLTAWFMLKDAPKQTNSETTPVDVIENIATAPNAPTAPEDEIEGVVDAPTVVEGPSTSVNANQHTTSTVDSKAEGTSKDAVGTSSIPSTPEKVVVKTAPTKTSTPTNVAYKPAVDESASIDTRKRDMLVETGIVEVIPYRNVDLTLMLPGLVDSQVITFKIMPPCIVKGLYNPYMAFSMGAFNWQNNLNASDQRYLDYRNANESSVLLPNIGLQYGGRFKNFQVASGLDYNEKGQNTAGTFKYLIYDSIPKVDLNGDTTWLPWNYRDTTTTAANNLRFRYISVPLNLGKAVSLNGPLTLNFGITGSLQFLAGAEGSSINSNYTLAATQHLSAYRRLTYTYGGYVGASILVSDQLSLSIDTRYIADGMSMFKNDNITQRLAGFGGQFRIQYKLRP